MKNIKKKISFAFLGICVLVFIQAMACFAADGTLQFSDPTGKVGDNITVTVKIGGNGSPIGDGDATLTYDASKLEFVSGTNATGGNGTVTLSASGTGTEVELNYEIVFKALAEGTTTIEVSSSTAYLFSDETLNLQHGKSTVTVEAADSGAPSDVAVTGSSTIEIDGTTYSVYNDFSDALVPDGFSRAAVSGDGYTYSGIRQETSGKQFIYVKKEGSEDPQMVLCDEEGGFILASPAMLTGEQYIYILGEMDGSSLPETFGETTLDLNGTIFPVWQDSENTAFYVVNALGPSGEISFYQYDTVDETYQRYIVKEAAAEKEEEEQAAVGNKLIDKVKAFIDKNLIMVVAVVAAVIFILLLILIIQGVILGNKKAELEDLQEDLQFDLSRSKKKKMKKQSRSEEDFDEYDDFEDDFDDFEEEGDSGDDEYDGYDEYEDEYEDEYDDEYDDDDEYEDDQDDNYNIDFIDL